MPLFAFARLARQRRGRGMMAREHPTEAGTMARAPDHWREFCAACVRVAPTPASCCKLLPAPATPPLTPSHPLPPAHLQFIHSDELVAKAAGRDLWHEDWLDAPWGTAAAPVEVTSVFSERVVGVPDPADDSIVWWGTVREGEPPRQIIEGGEYFVLKKISDGSGGGHH